MKGEFHPGANVLRLLLRQQAMIRRLVRRYRAARCARSLEAQESLRLGRVFGAAVGLHLRLQEEILYPAVRRLLREDPGLLDGLIAEHGALSRLLAELDEAPPDALLSGVRLAVLSDRLDHFFDRERDQLFPRLDSLALDLRALSRLMLHRRHALRAVSAV